jgi:hypothetical protein
MGASEKRKKQDEEAFSIKKEKRRRTRKLFRNGARSRWLTERIAAMGKAHKGSDSYKRKLRFALACEFAGAAGQSI